MLCNRFQILLRLHACLVSAHIPQIPAYFLLAMLHLNWSSCAHDMCTWCLTQHAETRPQKHVSVQRKFDGVGAVFHDTQAKALKEWWFECVPWMCLYTTTWTGSKIIFAAQKLPMLHELVKTQWFWAQIVAKSVRRWGFRWSTVRALNHIRICLGKKTTLPKQIHWSFP